MAKQKTEATTDLIPVPQTGGGALAPMGAYDLAELHEMMEGIDIRLPKIAILHQAQMIEMGNGEKVAEFTGRILDVHKANAWWAASFNDSGGGSPPQCSSLDGVFADPMSEDKQSDKCAECPQNKFGSDGGRGKACKNSKILHILLPGEILPSRLVLPPSSMKALDSYVTLLASRALPYLVVTTRFSVQKSQNKDGIAFGEIVLETISLNPPEEFRKLSELRKGLMPLMRGTDKGLMQHMRRTAEHE